MIPNRELLKYWTRVSGNRWLIAKMFGVLVSSTHLSYFMSKTSANISIDDFLYVCSRTRWVALLSLLTTLNLC